MSKTKNVVIDDLNTCTTQERKVYLARTDCMILRPKIKEWLFVAKKQFERLADIYESGKATELQIKSYATTKQRYESLASILMAMDDLIREK